MCSLTNKMMEFNQHVAASCFAYKRNFAGKYIRSVSGISMASSGKLIQIRWIFARVVIRLTLGAAYSSMVGAWPGMNSNLIRIDLNWAGILSELVG